MSKPIKFLSKSGGRWSRNVQIQIQHELCRTKATLIGGASVASKILDNLSGDLNQLKNINIIPKLVPIVVGDVAESKIYIRHKVKAADKLGIICDVQNYSNEIRQSELLKVIKALNNDHGVHGIIVQLPLPDHIDEHVVCNAVMSTKDVDGFTSSSLGRLVQRVDSDCKFSFVPCTALAVLKILRYGIDIDFKGLNACIVGRSHNVGMPIALTLAHDAMKGGLDMTTTICHRHTPPHKLAHACKAADVVVAAAGVPSLISPEMVKPGAIVVDVGNNRTIDINTGKRKLIGDVHPDVADVAGWMTPVPGGVGPCTVACLLHNTVLSAKNAIQRNDKS